MPPSPRKRERSKPRPNLSREVRRLIRDIARRSPELRHIRAERMLVIAGEARRASRASIRPMRFPGASLTAAGSRLRKPRVRFRGTPIYYIIVLRPLFFRSSTPEKRVETIIHELFHVSPAFDGSLDPTRRHSVLRASAFEGALRPIVTRYLARCPAKSIDRVAMNGEVLVRQWLEKPPNTLRPGKRSRHVYTEAQTFLGPVRMITRQTRH